MLEGAPASLQRLRIPRRLPARTATSAAHLWLQHLAWRRADWPADAIVLVRHLQIGWDEMSRRGSSPAFEACLRSAARPAMEPVPAAALAVWFAGPAELLACLARDALAGALQGQWWHRLAGPRAVEAQALPVALREARHIPAAVLLLQGWGAAEPWLRKIGAGGQAELVRALARHYPIAPMRQRQVLGASGATPPVVMSDAPPVGILERLQVHAPGPRTPDAERRTFTPPDPVDALLRLCLALAADPMAAAHEDAPASTGRELASEVSGASLRALPASPRPPAQVEPQVSARDAGTSASKAERLRGAEASASKTEPLRGAPPVAARPRRGVGDLLALASAKPAADLPSSSTESPLPPRSTPEAASLPDAAAPPAAAWSTTPPRPHPVIRAPSSRLHTAHGGLFFLLNVALHLGLYGDFTQPLHRGLAVSPWQFLRRAGRALCGPGFARDPLAAFLDTRIAAPTPDPLPDAWRMPADWLQPFAHDRRDWHAIERAGTLRVQHPAGFTVGWTPLRGTAEATAAELLSNLRSLAPPCRFHRTAAPARAKAEGLAPLWPYLRARLALAMGQPRQALALRQALRLRAQIDASAQRIDLHFALTDLPLAVRLAGLDRDPGWVPAAGCDFRFHFHTHGGSA